MTGADVGDSDVGAGIGSNVGDGVVGEGVGEGEVGKAVVGMGVGSGEVVGTGVGGAARKIVYTAADGDPYAPTTMSTTPSELKSPSEATDLPK